MRKILFFSLVCLISVLNTQPGSAFLGDEYSLDMYENIDEGINDLEEILYVKQLRTDKIGNTVSIRDKISEVAVTDADENCLINSDISATNIKNIQDGRFDTLFSAIKEECKGEEGELSMEYFLEYYSRTKDFGIESERIAERQAKAISEIARIGIYSDGNTENSPFDLIVDLQDINNIIFSKEIPYIGVLPLGNLDTAFFDDDSASLGQIYGEDFNLEGLSAGVEGNAQANGDGETSIIDLPAGDAFGLPYDGQNLVCIDSSETSGLSSETIIDLSNSEGDAPIFVPTSNFIGIETSEDEESGEESDNFTDVEYPQSDYLKMKDNDRWPCTEYFCIRVEFITKMHDFLVGGKTKSIESLVEVSNQHLKKFANTSLAQSRMTTQLFQTSMRDLNLPDMFHAGIQVQFMPPPILNLDSVNGEDNDQGGEFALDNLLSNYFKYNNLDYERQNDLQIFVDTDAERKTITHSQELSVDPTSEQFQAALEYRKNSKTEFARSVLDKSANNIDTKEFYQQFAELERFSKGMRDYAFAAATLIQQMRDIPINNGG